MIPLKPGEVCETPVSEEEISFELRLKLGRLLGQTFRLLGRAGKVLLKQRKGRPQKPLPPEARA